MCGVLQSYPNRCTWNQGHVLANFWHQEAEEWADIAFEESINPLPYLSELLREPAKASAWIRKYLTFNTRFINQWMAIIERDNDFIKQMWHLLFPSPLLSEQEWMPICFMNHLYMIVLTPIAWKQIGTHDIEQIRKYLPEVSTEWRLEAMETTEDEV